MAKTGFVWHEQFGWHDAGRASSSPWAEPYPALDRPESKRRLRNLLEVSGIMGELTPIEARPATDAELLRFHTESYLERIAELSEAGGGDAGQVAVIGPNGEVPARLAAGSCIEAADRVVSGQIDNAYALVRPAGHHAEPDRGRGFCIFANIVLAVSHVRAHHGVDRVAVVDWDVHHGNGTEQAFYGDPNVLTISLHQDRYYPVDTGGIDDVGQGAGRGANVNLPLPPGSGHGAYLAALERVVVPALRSFEPELIVVAAGYDAAVSDPLGRMLCHSETYRFMARKIVELSGELCGGRLLICHEGGYSPTYVPFCGLAVIEELTGKRTEVEDPFLDWYTSMGGQDLQPAQEAVIAEAAKRFGSP